MVFDVLRLEHECVWLVELGILKLIKGDFCLLGSEGLVLEIGLGLKTILYGSGRF